MLVSFTTIFCQSFKLFALNEFTAIHFLIAFKCNAGCCTFPHWNNKVTPSNSRASFFGGKGFPVEMLAEVCTHLSFFLCIIIQFSKGKTKCVDLLLTCLHNVAGAVPSIAF